jgi:hypothetical protein
MEYDAGASSQAIQKAWEPELIGSVGEVWKHVGEEPALVDGHLFDVVAGGGAGL